MLHIIEYHQEMGIVSEGSKCFIVFLPPYQGSGEFIGKDLSLEKQIVFCKSRHFWKSRVVIGST